MRSGQRYLAITAKHHDGFCLFMTAPTDLNVVGSTSFGLEDIAELAAVRRFGAGIPRTGSWPRRTKGASSGWGHRSGRIRA
ncbi:MAG: alpha-L-fucosidase [Phycisphaerae bacterium]